MPPLTASTIDATTPDTVAELLGRVRASAPLVHSITNNVVTGFTANALLALGAAPAMVDIVGEAGLFARVAGGLLVNLGTPTPEQRGAIAEAVAGARDAGTPWVLDPVAIGALPIRTRLAAELVAQQPTAVRGNPSEVLALSGAGAGGRGVESTDSAASARAAAVELAARFGTVVAVSGEEDLITDGRSVVWVEGGDALLTKVTGGGCALGSIVAAFLAVRGEISALDALVAAHVSYGVAAERAAARAGGPGSFAVELLDALAAITAGEVAAGTRIRVEPAGESATAQAATGGFAAAQATSGGAA
ncbi:hydroxyethylthiazole kinase [Gulosibacter sp. ACHW.36C]|uniref:Hydroxyethylthiazole kinase n=1 Tax=Gulosibacter sediminis TaxID=1729695 RepID=A0ABY4MW31_9MICO|nr:hydroxyethylthiazole kinase [Gulosibacter sediminis]UQN14254.1 hydroxyethylthiazole kinase [Gulosibacter sediminis]